MDSTNRSKSTNPVPTLTSDASHAPSLSIAPATMPLQKLTTSELEMCHSIVNATPSSQSTVPLSEVQGPSSSNQARPQKRRRRTKKKSRKARQTQSSDEPDPSSDSDSTFDVKKLKRSLCPVKTNLKISIAAPNPESYVQVDVPDNNQTLIPSSSTETELEEMEAIEPHSPRSPSPSSSFDLDNINLEYLKRYTDNQLAPRSSSIADLLRQPFPGIQTFYVMAPSDANDPQDVSEQYVFLDNPHGPLEVLCTYDWRSELEPGYWPVAVAPCDLALVAVCVDYVMSHAIEYASRLKRLGAPVNFGPLVDKTNRNFNY